MLRLDGAPVDQKLLQSMTAALAFRGPDAQRVWSAGEVGLGHALLRTTDEAGRESQPVTFDNEVWCASDVRLDARTALVEELRRNGRAAEIAAPDVELLLHAYPCWGENLLEHITGDFSFAIWDGRRKSLFCANDHFAVRPFYYARTRDCFVFSNTLDCVRVHPDVSAQLNELAIADFLLVGLNWDPSTTSFEDIRRLPPAHQLTCTNGEISARRYWSFPVEEPLRYKRNED